LSDVIYREARPEDIPTIVDVFLASSSDMYSRYNIKDALPPRPALAVACKHILSTGIFHLAEIDGQVVTIASAIVRDHLFFLSTFWARPDQQRKGVGMPLLKRLWESGKAAGATTFFTHSSSDLPAMAAYMKLGMLPGYQVVYFQGEPQRLPAVAPGYEALPLEKKTAVDLDLQVRGTGREADHEFWSGDGGLKGRQVLRHGKVIGYYYLSKNGIGPAAWTGPQEAEAVMTLACGEAAAAMPEVRFGVPGINHSGLRFGLESGLRITTVYHFLTTSPFGRMEQYILSGPSLY
jgi:hypothetical protein